MHIVVITGSPHRNGTTAALADAFIEGAREAGHDIFRFDAAKEKYPPVWPVSIAGQRGAVSMTMGCRNCFLSWSRRKWSFS